MLATNLLEYGLQYFLAKYNVEIIIMVVIFVIL